MDVTKKELYTTKRSSGVDISDSHIIPTLDLIKQDSASENWAWLVMVDIAKVELKESDSKGMEGLLA